MQNDLIFFNIKMIICHFASESLLHFRIFSKKVFIKTQESTKRQISQPRMIGRFIKHNILAPCKIKLVSFRDLKFFMHHVRLNWACLPRMHDLENAEFSKSTISQPRSCFYYS